MRIVTHEYSDTYKKLSELPSFCFKNARLNRSLITSDKPMLLGSIINRIYVDSFDFPLKLDESHKCLFIVEPPYYNGFCTIYQQKFGHLETSFDTLFREQKILWIEDTFNIGSRKANKLYNYFSGSLLRMLYNTEIVQMYLDGQIVDESFNVLTYETIYRYLMGDVSVTKSEYLQVLSKYRNSYRSIVKWLTKKLKSSDSSPEQMRLLFWLKGKIDLDLLIFAKEGS